MADNAGFTAAIKAFELKTKAQLDELVRSSVIDVAQDAQMNVPVKTGRLKKSLVSSVNGAPLEPGLDAILRGEAGDYFDVGWTMFYAPFVERGTRGAPARMFLGLAVERWDMIVARNADIIRNQG